MLTMATKKIAHVLSDEEQIEAIAKRIKRAQGQLGAIARMLEEDEQPAINSAEAIKATIFFTISPLCQA